MESASLLDELDVEALEDGDSEEVEVAMAAQAFRPAGVEMFAFINHGVNALVSSSIEDFAQLQVKKKKKKKKKKKENKQGKKKRKKGRKK